MQCPKCDKPMQTRNTYTVPFGQTATLVCDCGLVAVTETVIVEIDPAYGKGAAARAQRLSNGKQNGLLRQPSVSSVRGS